MGNTTKSQPSDNSIPADSSNRPDEALQEEAVTAPTQEAGKPSQPAHHQDVVDEASAGSFPASDPPNWATGQQRRPRNS